MLSVYRNDLMAYSCSMYSFWSYSMPWVDFGSAFNRSLSLDDLKSIQDLRLRLASAWSSEQLDIDGQTFLLSLRSFLKSANFWASVGCVSTRVLTCCDLDTVYALESYPPCWHILEGMSLRYYLKANLRSSFGLSSLCSYSIALGYVQAPIYFWYTTD